MQRHALDRDRERVRILELGETRYSTHFYGIVCLSQSRCCASKMSIVSLSLHVSKY